MPALEDRVDPVAVEQVVGEAAAGAVLEVLRERPQDRPEDPDDHLVGNLTRKGSQEY